MRTIHKVVLETADTKTYRVKGSAPRVLSVQLQRGTPMLWYEITESQSPDFYSNIHVAMVGTGHNAEHSAHHRFVDTVQLYEGNLIFHVYAREA